MRHSPRNATPLRGRLSDAPLITAKRGSRRPGRGGLIKRASRLGSYVAGRCTNGVCVWLSSVARADRLFLLLGLLLAEYTPASIVARAAPLDSGALFRSFLEQPPPVKTIVFRLSNRYSKLGVGGGRHLMPGEGKETVFTFNGFSKYEAAIQPQGYYIKVIESPFQYGAVSNLHYLATPPRAGEEVVYGADAHFFWSLNKKHEGIGLAPKPPDPGASPQNYGSLKESMDEFRFRELAEHMEKRDFASFVRAETV